MLELMKPLEDLLVDTRFPTGGRVRFDFDAVLTTRTLWEMLAHIKESG